MTDALLNPKPKHPLLLGKEASAHHDIPTQVTMELYMAIRKYLHANAVALSDTTIHAGISKRMQTNIAAQTSLTSKVIQPSLVGGDPNDVHETTPQSTMKCDVGIRANFNPSVMRFGSMMIFPSSSQRMTKVTTAPATSTPLR